MLCFLYMCIELFTRVCFTYCLLYMRYIRITFCTCAWYTCVGFCRMLACYEEKEEYIYTYTSFPIHLERNASAKDVT